VKRPSEVNILGHRVPILALPEQADDRNAGLSSTTAEVIYVLESLPDGVWDEILIHEVLHYLGDTLGKDLTEEQVKGLSSGLFSMGVRIR
jgi:hypothetical protein